jgi:hypothetical protein
MGDMTDNITPAAAPEPTPPPAAAAPPAATPYVAPVGYTPASPTKRPGTATAGIVIISIQAVLSVIVALVLFGTLAGIPSGTEGLANAQLLSGVVLAGGIINGIAIIFVARGYGLARFAIVVAGGIVVLIDLISLTPAFGDFLWILAVVLLFLPQSNAWFKAKAAQRSGVTA